MIRHLTIKHRYRYSEEQDIENWFDDNGYLFKITGASNDPFADDNVTRTTCVILFTEEAEVATRLKWNVE